jgi:hypothetical protein
MSNRGTIMSNKIIVSAVFLLGLAPIASADEQKEKAVPNLTGPWLNDNAFMLIPSNTGPRPIGDLAGYVHHERGVDANGNDVSTNAYIGDYTNGLLTSWASEIMKKEAEDAITGKDPFWPASFCYPFGPTVLLQPEPLVFIQTPAKVTLFYQRDHQVRHVYLNVPHSTNPKPSWYGESVGHYEGDTLLIDTVGFNTKSFVDRYGTPYSDQLHLVERYRMSADGKNLIADVTYDDPKAYTTKWSAVSKYHRGRVMPDEVACAESQLDPVTGQLNAIPMAGKPDF